MIKLFKFLKPYSLSIGIVFILIFFQSLSDLYLPRLLSDIVDIGIARGDTHYILKVGGRMLLVAAGGTISSIIANFLSSKISTGFGSLLRDRVFTQVENFSLQEFDRIGTASLITRTTNDITQLQQVTMMFLRIMVSAPILAIGGMIMAVSQDAKLALILVVVLPILGFVIFMIGKKGMPLFKLIQVKLDRLNLVLREKLMGIRVIRAFDRVEYENQRFHKANEDLTMTSIKVNRLMAALMPIMMLLMNFTTIAIIWFGSIRINNGSIQLGSLMAFIQYVTQIMFSMMMFSMMFVMIPRASASAIRINEVLDIMPEIMDSENPIELQNKISSVEFENVTFSYPGAEEPALKNISFCMASGETTAIIGGTGSGKSTLVSLIPRFYDIDSGRVLINGVDIREITQKSLREKIGFVPQKTLLFTGSIEDNIRYGKEDATDEELKKASEIAQAMEFISNMEEGLGSSIAQGGTNVSGGQKQRLSIARALVRRPEIYIFDDSFSALDFKTDVKLRKALKKETKNAIVMIVGQRVSTVMDADQIIVLNEGRIAGMGKHEELLKTCDVYREIVASQLSEEELA